ncbi:hypothetical protein [Gorillibacterium sp. sgz500922]|uniref:hypothetical protein n=1 Tax=Gorillibacterium sp. sgz500922 TaxID=3446694 RepID=UPI003F677A29
MKKGGIHLLMAAVVLISGCSSTKNLDSSSLKTFRKQMNRDIPGMTSFKTVAKPTRVLFRCAFKKEPEATVQMDVVKRTDDYMRTDAFKTEVLEAYFKSFSKDRILPDIVIPMDTDRDGEANFEYYAAFEKNGEWSWHYNDYKGKHQKIELP